MHERLRILLAVATVALSAARAEDLKETEKALVRELRQQEKATEAIKKKLKAVRVQLRESKRKVSVSIDRTQFHIPKMAKPPQIDGVVDEREWAGAIGVPITSGIHGMFMRPSSYFYLGWDEENLYFGQRLPMREGEQPLRLNREPKHDNVYCGETSLEAYVDRKSSGSHGSLCRWQFMGNAVANKWDREDQYQIGQNFIGWNGRWEYQQRLTPDGKFWEAEIAIPRKTVYQEAPLQDGDVWWIGLATNLHRPWCFSGFYGWRIPATFTVETPEIRMFHPERSIRAKGIVCDVVIRNTTSGLFKAQLVSQLTDPREKNPEKGVVFEKARAIHVPVGGKQRFEIKDIIGDKAQDRKSYQMSVIVQQGDKSVYTWAYPIRYNHPDNFAGLDYTPDKALFPLETAYNPLSNCVRVVADKYDYAKSDRVAKIRFLIRAESREQILAQGEITEFKYGKGETRVPVPADLSPGSYVCEAQMLDANGAVLDSEEAPFVRRDHRKEFPWLFAKNAVGEDDILLRPFAPLDVRGSVIRGFKKEITLDGSGLPEKIVAADVNLLRGPMALVGEAAGASFTVAGLQQGLKWRERSSTRAIYSGSAAGGALEVGTDVRWEYDGTAKVRLTLTPERGKARLDSLRLVIPFTEEGAVNYIANAENMRLSNQAGRIPGKGKTGVVWDSTSVEYQNLTVGTFVPFMWIGNLKSGLTWFADSDRGWWPSDKKPAIEIVRDEKGRVSLVLNLCSDPVELAAARQIVFGLNVNPVRLYSDHRSSAVTFGFLEETGRWDTKKSRGKVYARRYPENPELCKRFADRAHYFGRIFAPYTEMSAADFEPEVFAYFKEEWSRGGMRPNAPHMTETANDYLSWLFDRWVRDCGVDGLYFDNVFCKLTWNTASGGAYELPDGRIQPGYNLWGLRDNVKRVRTILQKHKGDRPYRICIHNTRFQFAPIMGFADLAMGGEMPTPRGDNPGAGDFMDMYPRSFMDIMYNQPLWGYKQNHLYHFRWNSYVDEMGAFDYDAALKVHRGAMATMLTHGIEFFQGIKYESYLSNQFAMIKSIAGGTLKFMPQWDAKGLFKLVRNPRDQEVAVWTGNDVLLVVVANYSKHKARPTVWLDFPKLLSPPGRDERRVTMDFETLGRPEQGFSPGRQFPDERFPRLDGGADATIHIPNQLRCTVEGRDFRAYLFANLPLGGRGSGF